MRRAQGTSLSRGDVNGRWVVRWAKGSGGTWRSRCNCWKFKYKDGWALGSKRAGAALRGNSGHILEKSHRAPPQGVARALPTAGIRDSLAAQTTGAKDVWREEREGGVFVKRCFTQAHVAQSHKAGQHLTLAYFVAQGVQKNMPKQL